MEGGLKTTANELVYAASGGGQQFLLYRGPAFRDAPGVVLKGVFDPVEANARAVARAYAMPVVYPTFEAILRDAEVDVVIISGPHEVHAEQAIAAMEAGKDVFVEKPMAVDPSSAREMVTAARRDGVVLMVGYQYAYGVDAALELVQRGVIGPVVGARARWSRAKMMKLPPAFWANPATGGVILDFGGHLYSAVQPLVPGHPISVKATSDNAAGLAWDPRFAVESRFSATIRHSGGAVIQLEGDWADDGPADEEFRFIVYGTEGEIEGLFPCFRRDVESLCLLVRKKGQPPGEPPSIGAAPLVYHDLVLAQAGDFHSACVLRRTRRVHASDPGVAPRFTDSRALMVETVVHAIRDAAATGRKVSLRDAWW
jgi:predicted dehydrogenase